MMMSALNGLKIIFTRTVFFASNVKKSLTITKWFLAKAIPVKVAAITFTRQLTLSITNHLRRFVFGFTPLI